MTKRNKYFLMRGICLALAVLDINLTWKNRYSTKATMKTNLPIVAAVSLIGYKANNIVKSYR